MKIQQEISSLTAKAAASTTTLLWHHGALVLFAVGVLLLSSGLGAMSQAQSSVPRINRPPSVSEGGVRFGFRQRGGTSSNSQVLARTRVNLNSGTRRRVQIAQVPRSRTVNSVQRQRQLDVQSQRTLEAKVIQDAVRATQGTNPTFTFSEARYDDALIRATVGNLFKLVEGAFGALIMVVAGLAAIIAAAMGSYKSALAMLVVAVGSFILRALVSLFFGTNFTDFSVNS